jgi:cytidine deaminase
MAESETQTSEIQALYQAAVNARRNAYAPYSGCLVGAAIRTAAGGLYVGCNVENASYGATICAERVAIGAAVSAEAKPQIVAVMVVTDAEVPWPPCGMCRQVIVEFGSNCMIYCANLQGEIKSTPFAELYPQAFAPEHLRAS